MPPSLLTRSPWSPSPPRGFTWLDKGLAVGEDPATPAEVEALYERGFKGLLNLSQEGEPDQRLSPNVEATWAHTFELEHERAAMNRHPSPADVDRFLQALAKLPRPVYAHSTHGRRALALSAIALALQRERSAAEALQELERRGQTLDDAWLARWVEDEIETRGALRARN